MVSSELCITRICDTKARSNFYSFCIRKNFYVIVGILAAFYVLHSDPVSAVEWQEPQTDSSWKGLWGIPGDNVIYLGMWTTHMPGHNSDKNNDNRLIGLAYRGIFGATFINSYYKRSYTVGIQRIIYSQKFSNYFQLDAGYRLGAIWGYKNTKLLRGLERSIPGATQMNPIPFGQIIANVSWEMIGVQFSYCWVVFSVGFYVKF